jgi:glc operon protein GlcG
MRSALRTALLLFASSLVVTRVGAQVVSHPVLSAEAVKKALAAAEAEARRNGWNVSIAVVDPAGTLLGFARMDDASAASVEVSQAKARSAARFRRATKAFEETVAGGRTAIMTLPGVVAVEGGVPLLVDGKVVAAVGVSGATSAQDAQVATAGVVGAGGTVPAAPAR